LRADGKPGRDDDDVVDPRFDEAVTSSPNQRCSTSWLQRKMTIGYNQAAKMVEDGSGAWSVRPAAPRPQVLCPTLTTGC
jgi:DNA segregation ATPase FtsK/SpoIIIE-like protein